MRILFLTDLHVGHPKCPAELVRQHLELLVYPRLDGIDLVVVGGDFYDRLLDLNGVEGYHAISIIRTLRTILLERKILLRVIRGTYSHDRMQNRMFLIDYDAGIPNIGEDPSVAVIDNVTIERLNGLGLDVLYVPGDTHHKELNQFVVETVHNAGLKQVDLFVHHGYFDHMVPPGARLSITHTLNWETIAPVVRGWVLNGHVHIPMIKDRVVSGGSMERFCHGEEETKGFFILDYDQPSGRCVHQFIENPYASVFATFDATPWEHDHEAASGRYRKWLEALISKVPIEVSMNVRAIVGSLELGHILGEITGIMPRDINYTRMRTSKNKVESVIDLTAAYQEPEITESNLAEMVREHLRTRNLDIDVNKIAEVLHGQG